MSEASKASTALCTYTNEAIYLRDRSLVDDLIGKVDFTEGMYFLIFGRMPTKAQRRKSTLWPKYSGRRKKPRATTFVTVPMGVAMPPTLDANAVMSSSAEA